MKRTDVNYLVEVSSDPEFMALRGRTHRGPSDSETQLVVRDAQPISSEAKRFIRLAVQPLP